MDASLCRTSVMSKTVELHSCELLSWYGVQLFRAWPHQTMIVSREIMLFGPPFTSDAQTVLSKLSMQLIGMRLLKRQPSSAELEV
jgi:hypothetical protein